MMLIVQNMMEGVEICEFTLSCSLCPGVSKLSKQMASPIGFRRRQTVASVIRKKPQ